MLSVNVFYLYDSNDHVKYEQLFPDNGRKKQKNYIKEILQPRSLKEFDNRFSSLI